MRVKNFIHPYFLANSHALINLRKQAKDLLEHAKRAVEISIEKNEQTAINWLESVSEVAALHLHLPYVEPATDP